MMDFLNSVESMYTYLLALVVSVQLVSSPPAADDTLSRLDITLDEVLVIGAEEADSTEYLFGKPTSVVPGTDRHIYVADRLTQNVRVFNATGIYARTLGRRGEGPGEFASLSTLTFDTSGHLLVMDPRRYRLTRFRPETGEAIGTYSLANRFTIGPASFQPGPRVDDGSLTYIFLLNRKLPKFTTDNDRFFAVLGGEMKQVHATFGEYDLAHQPDRFAKLYAVAYPGHFIVIGSGDVWFAPGIYTGTVHRFTYEGDGRWAQAQGAKGYVEEGRPHVTIDPEGERRDDYVFFRTIEQADAGRSRNTSAGLVRLSTGEIVHFTYYIRDERGHIIAEVFSPEGTLIGWDVVYEDLPGQAYPPLRAMSIDGDDRIYWIDEVDVPRVRVTTFAYEATE